ncbi:MAG: glycoside hydrolase family 99-like domain-containing protein [Bacteroidales bacterium]|jgi:lipopolysaccharide biosynthesis protein
MLKKARLIAFYLPQFHPIPENDKWHGKGFTEWTNVTKAKPLFKGHYQPILPSELGFYDLRVPEIRIAQAELAKEYGIEAFCYWHYWFGNGKRILERPFNEVIESGEPDFPFCLAWANSSWTGIWYGMSDNTLLEQTYPGAEDHKSHFYAMLNAFRDKRYFKVNGKLLFFIYDPLRLPNSKRFMELWQELAKKEGLNGFYFVGATHYNEVLEDYDATTHLDPFESPPLKHNIFDKITLKLFGKDSYNVKRLFKRIPRRVQLYEELANYLEKKQLKENEFPLIAPNWDNTARCKENGSVLHNSTPELFEKMLQNAIGKIEHIKEPDKRIIFVEAWNEWAEGNYLEPDMKFGRGYLEVIKRNIFIK